MTDEPSPAPSRPRSATTSRRRRRRRPRQRRAPATARRRRRDPARRSDGEPAGLGAVPASRSLAEWPAVDGRRRGRPRCAGRPPSRRRPHRRLVRRGRPRPHRRSSPVDGPRLRPGRHHRCTARSGSTCPATSARPSARSSRSSRASPTRPRSTPSSTRSSTSSSATRPTTSRRTPATSSRGSTASSRSASGPLPPAAALKERPSRIGDFRALRPALGQGSGRRPRPGSTQAAHQGRRDDDDRDLPAARPDRLRAERRASRSAYGDRSTARSPSLGDLASVKAAIDTNGAGAFANEPGPKAALAAADGDHVGFVYIGAPAAARLVERRSPSRWAATSGVGAAARRRRSADDDLAALVPEWAAYWLRFENDAIVMEATHPPPEPASARPRTAHRPSSSTSRRRVVAVGSPTTSARPSSRRSTCYRSDRASSRCVDQLDQAARPASAARRRRDRLDRRHGDRRRRRRRHAGGRPHRRADRRRRRAEAASPASSASSPSAAPSRASRQRRGLQRDDDHDRRPRRSRAS